jgi:hypothetical protein
MIVKKADKRTVYIVAEKRSEGGLNPDHLIAFELKEDAEQFIHDHTSFSWGPELVIIEADYRGKALVYTGIREPVQTPPRIGGGGIGSVF